KRFLTDLARDWEQHGPEVFKRVRPESPAAYLKVCAMLVPREMQIEHSGGVKAMSDEALENAIEALERMLGAKVIEGVAEPVPALPPPSRKARRKVQGAKERPSRQWACGYGCGNGQHGRKVLNSQHRHRASSVPMWLMPSKHWSVR